MKRALVVLVILASSLAVPYLVVRMAVHIEWKRAGRLQWPAGLGTLEDFPKAFPKQAPTPAALRLLELARPLEIDLTPGAKRSAPIHDTIKKYVNARRGANTYPGDPPTPEILEFLHARESEIDAVRDHLLQHGPEIGWAIDLNARFNPPLPNLRAHYDLLALLIARAGLRAFVDDARAWLDLEAASQVVESLCRRPDPVSQLVGLSMGRAVNAVVWKMPMPAPAHFARAPQADPVRITLRAMQAETWLYWRFGPETAFSPTLSRAMIANLAIHQRDSAAELSRITACKYAGERYVEQQRAKLPSWNAYGRAALPNYGRSMQRTRAFVAEREAADRALRIRAGEPFDAHSQCSDGTWRYENGMLSFTGDLGIQLLVRP